ncbi:MAG: hypothetical protein Ct9H300mP28_24410 [Pseudomonadota bacterium]|nr:MAG: hypothetical protein Ct9H300mP28_24410 [Pseudomonadota bacterium]
MKEIAAVGITNQRESTIAGNRNPGEAIAPAINWQCRPTADFCEKLKEEGFDRVLRKKGGAGNRSLFFPGKKMVWVLEKSRKGRSWPNRGTFVFGTLTLG